MPTASGRPTAAEKREKRAQAEEARQAQIAAAWDEAHPGESDAIARDMGERVNAGERVERVDITTEDERAAIVAALKRAQLDYAHGYLIMGGMSFRLFSGEEPTYRVGLSVIRR